MAAATTITSISNTSCRGSPVRAKAAGKYAANARGFIDKRLRTSPSAPPWACTCAAELEGVALYDWRRGGGDWLGRCST
jgi:hypothetical protein